MGFFLAVLAFPLTIFLEGSASLAAGMGAVLFTATYGVARLATGRQPTGPAQIALFGLYFLGLLTIEIAIFAYVGKDRPNFPQGLLALAIYLTPILGLPTLVSWCTYAAALWIWHLRTAQ
jgi:hypothetical protein